MISMKKKSILFRIEKKNLYLQFELIKSNSS